MRAGKGVSVNKEEAARLYKEEADENDINSMYNYAVMLKNGEGVKTDKKEAVFYLKKAIKKGHSESMLEYSKMLQNGDGVEADKEKAERSRKMAVKAENNMKVYLAANELICNCHREREGLELLRKAADEGCFEAMRDLALILSNGSNGIGMNKRESALYFKKAADLGNVDSMLKYAMMVDAGEGVEIDRKESAKYFKMH